MLPALGDEGKAAVLASVDMLCVPAIGGESFGIVLSEAMAAGTPVVASDLDAFRLRARRRAGWRVGPGRITGRAGDCTR